MQTKSPDTTASGAAIDELLQARVLAVVIGAVILFTVGFAQMTPVHNAAHDTRHTLAFPCH